MKSVCARFSTTRMVAEYCRDYYMPARAPSARGWHAGFWSLPLSQGDRM
jgi:hypothetical protein